MPGNSRRREWTPAIEASGVRRPARIYDLRSTFAWDALNARVPVFQLARIMGTSVRMIETLLDGSGAEIAGRLDVLNAQRERGDRARSEPMRRLGHCRVTTSNDQSPETALEWEAADGIRTHDLLHGKQTL